MKRATRAWPLLLLAASGCLASKSDIQLLQDEFRATRAQIAHGDTSATRANDDRAQQIAQLSAKIDRLEDSLRTLTRTLASFQATANGEFDALSGQIGQVGERLGQTTRGLQDTRAQLQALREQQMGGVPTAATPGAPGADTTGRGAAPPTGPGPATMFNTALQQLREGAYNSARSGFDSMIQMYPTAEQAPTAQLNVAEAYKNLGTTAAADSVYQLVVTKYPGTPVAASALYRRGKMLWDAGKRSDARTLFNKVLKEYPKADEVGIIKRLLGEG